MKKKIAIELEQFKKLGRMYDFTLAHRDHFAADTPAAKDAPALISTVNNLNALTAAHSSLENRLRELSRAKTEARTALYDEMEFLYHTAHSIAAEAPGFDDKFQMPLKGDSKLLNAARSAVQDAAPLAEILVKNAMRPDFLESLNVSIRRFERTSEEYANGRTACALSEKALRASLATALAAAHRFDAIMRNTFRNDPITLAAWKDVCRIQRVPRKSKEAEPKAAVTPATPEADPSAPSSPAP